MVSALWLALAPAHAQVVLRNDTAYDDNFTQANSSVVWLAFPECAITVLEADPADLPLEVDTLSFLFTSNTGNHSGQTTLAEIGIQLLQGGQEPDNALPYAWGPEGVSITVSTSAFNQLLLENTSYGWDNVLVSQGERIAVWICTPDPDTGYAWPHTNDRDTSGLMIHTSAPDEGNYVFYNDEVVTLESLGAPGAWVIRAIAGFTGTTGPTGTTGTTGTTWTGTGGPLALQSVTPDSTTEGVPEAVVLLGTGFVENTAVYVGGLLASGVDVTSPTALQATTPSALPVGDHDVVVQNPDGSSATLPAGFTVFAAEEVAPDSCGCSGGAGAAWLGLLAPVFVVTRRRRAA